MDAITKVISEVAVKHRFTTEDLLGKRMSPVVISHARGEAYFLLKRDFHLSVYAIGRIFNRHHTSVAWGIRSHCSRISLGEIRSGGGIVWPVVDIERLISLAEGGATLREAAEALGRTENSCKKKLQALRLEKQTKAYFSRAIAPRRVKQQLPSRWGRSAPLGEAEATNMRAAERIKRERAVADSDDFLAALMASEKPPTTLKMKPSATRHVPTPGAVRSFMSSSALIAVEG